MISGTNVFLYLIYNLCQEMGIGFVCERYQMALSICTALFALICCFFGRKCFSVIGACTTFFVTALVICRIFGAYVDKGVLVTTFDLLGLMMAFLMFRWHRGAAVFLSFMAAFYAVASMGGGLLLCILVGIVLAVMADKFTDYVIIIVTALFGALGFSLMLTALGLTVQILMNRKYIYVRSNKQYKMRAPGKIKKISDSYVPKYANGRRVKL